MLIPVDFPGRQRFWVDVTFCCEKYIYADTPDAVSKYLLKNARVRGTYSDEQISDCVQCSFAGMLRDGVPRDLALQEVSEVYGIPPACVASVIDDNADSRIPVDAALEKRGIVTIED